MNSIQAVMCVIAVCAVTACGVIGYEYTVNDADDPTEDGQENNIMATSGTCGDNLTWELTQHGSQAGEYILTITGTGSMADYDTSSSRPPWYYYRTEIIAISIGSGVTTIGTYAFYQCTGLTSLTIPNSVTSIGERAFYECTGLTSLTLGTGVMTIGNLAFTQCNITTIYNQSSLVLTKGSTTHGSVAFHATTLVQGDATLTLNRASIDPTDQWTPRTITVKPGESESLPGNYPSFTTTEPAGTNKVRVITHTATGWTEQ